MGRWSRAALAVIVIALVVAGIALVVTEVRASDADDGPSASRLAADRECVETDAPSLARLPTAKLSLTEVGTAVEPTSAVFAPDGSGDGLLSERNGRVLRIEGGSITDEVVLDLTDDTMQEGDGGLLALAYDAGAEWLYAYRADAAGDDVLTAYPLDDAGAPDGERGRVILAVDHPDSVQHHGGALVIGPDELLYLGLGDGGGLGDPARQRAGSRRPCWARWSGSSPLRRSLSRTASRPTTRSSTSPAWPPRSG